jgi:hypothetical protein
MNDSWVSQTSEREVFQQTPYILFYERIMETKSEKKDYISKEVSNETKVNEPKVEEITVVPDIIYPEYNYDEIQCPKNFQSKHRRKIKNIIKFYSRMRENNKEEIIFIDNTPSTSIDNDSVKTIESDNSDKQIKKHINQSTSKKVNPSEIVYNRNLTNLYGSDKIQLWCDEDNSQLLKSQIKFIKSVQDFKEKSVLQKDEYDVEYDQGKLKKVKTKEKIQRFSNVFQNVHDHEIANK